VVFDLYDFEMASFFYVGAGFSAALLGNKLKESPGKCLASLTAGGYIGRVTGWGSYYPATGVQNYQGESKAYSGSLTTPFGIPTAQAFQSKDGKLQGYTWGLGVGTDILPFGYSDMNNLYSPPIPTSHLRFHGEEDGEPLAPSDLDVLAFINAATVAFAGPATLGTGTPLLVTQIIPTILKNAQEWKIYDYQHHRRKHLNTR
jgi:hypothetical protein